jgi:hypothetical protein
VRRSKTVRQHAAEVAHSLRHHPLKNQFSRLGEPR